MLSDEILRVGRGNSKCVQIVKLLLDLIRGLEATSFAAAIDLIENNSYGCTSEEPRCQDLYLLKKLVLILFLPQLLLPQNYCINRDAELTPTEEVDIALRLADRFNARHLGEGRHYSLV